MTQNNGSGGGGLELFDERASAVRGFPVAMRGYDKKAVDDYVRDMEQQLSAAKHQYREVQRELTAAHLRNDDTDFSKLGGHAQSLLKVAESQAGDLVTKAQVEADRILSEAREEAARVHNEAVQRADSHRATGIDELRGLRAELERQSGSELDAVRTEAQGLRDAADQHRTMILADAQQQANGMIEAARAEAAHIVQRAEQEAAQLHDRVTRETNALRADTTAAVEQLREQTAAEVAETRNALKVEVANARARLGEEAQSLRDQADAEATQIRTAVAVEREESLAKLSSEQGSLRDQLVAMLGQARQQSEDVQAKLSAAAADLRMRQQAAYAEAERIKTDAINEAAAIIDRAQNEADQHRHDTQGALERRSEELRREHSMLRQRKEALVAQLNNLSSLANLTALEFPDDDDAPTATAGEDDAEGQGHQ